MSVIPIAYLYSRSHKALCATVSQIACVLSILALPDASSNLASAIFQERLENALGTVKILLLRVTSGVEQEVTMATANSASSLLQTNIRFVVFKRKMVDEMLLWIVGASRQGCATANAAQAKTLAKL
ncbi:MAG: hypothetical protein AAF215_27580 [Cyanobacteria bacterium P01_A01_bin.123]